MNCASRAIPHIRDRASRVALWTMGDGAVTFGEFGALAAGVQHEARARGLVPGRPVLVLDSPGPRLFATITGLMGVGVPVLAVEPWLPVADIDHVIALARPQAFIGGTLAMLWALRVAEIRRTPSWIHIRRMARPRTSEPFRAEDVDEATPAVITFTSGTTGRPKGIARSHRYIWDVTEIITEGGTRDQFDGPDLCVFPNMALLHLGTGRGALVMPMRWDDRAFRAITALPAALQPRSVSCGPAFLLRMLDAALDGMPLGSLSSVTIGGALTDCHIVEHGMRRWSDATWTHVYGGTEAEPVAHADARESLRKSRDRGLFQLLHVGAPIPEIMVKESPEGLWVSGPNVAPAYLGEHPDNALVKQVDETGRHWHCMGDRVTSDADGWWYGGRATQPAADFDLEQRIYSHLRTSKCFVHRGRDGRAVLFGEGVREVIDRADAAFAVNFPEVTAVREVKILRDRRHRARIDRRASLAKGGYRPD